LFSNFRTGKFGVALVRIRRRIRRVRNAEGGEIETPKALRGRGTVADPKFHNGVESRAVPPPQKKFEFLPENSGFWCIPGLLFTFMQKLVRPMGGRQPPPGSATGGEWGGGNGIPLSSRLGVWGSVVSSPSGVRGGALAENGF